MEDWLKFILDLASNRLTAKWGRKETQHTQTEAEQTSAQVGGGTGDVSVLEMKPEDYFKGHAELQPYNPMLALGPEFFATNTEGLDAGVAGSAAAMASGMAQAGGAIDQARLSGLAQADSWASKVDQWLPEQDFDARERALLDDIGAASGARQQQLREGISGAAIQQHGTNEAGNLARMLGENQEAQYRGGAVRGVQGQMEALRQQFEQARAGLKGSLSGQAMNMETAFGNAMASLFGAGGLQQAGAVTSAERSKIDFAAMDEGELWNQMANQWQMNESRKAYEDWRASIFGAARQDYDRNQWVATIPSAKSYFQDKPKDAGSGLSFGLEAGPVSGGWEDPGCLSADTSVVTEAGIRPLSDVSQSDRVLGGDGRYHAVVAKDCGYTPLRLGLGVLKLRTVDGLEIVMTGDHEIDGRPAGEYQPNDPIGKTVLDSTEPVVSHGELGDIMLDGCSTYWAGGFEVESVIERGGLDRYAERLGVNGTKEVDGILISTVNHDCWINTEKVATCQR